MATRIMAAWFLTHQDNSNTPVAVGFTSKCLQPYRVVDARDSNDAGTLLQGAIEDYVLVKNTNETLPLIMSVFGYDARPPNGNTPNIGNSGWSLSLQSNNWRSVVCGFWSGRLGICPPFSPIPQNGTAIVDGGSGGNPPAISSRHFRHFKNRQSVTVQH